MTTAGGNSASAVPRNGKEHAIIGPVKTWTVVLVLLPLFAACGGPTQTAAPAAAAEAVATNSRVAGTVAIGAVVTLPASGPDPLPEGPAVMDQISKRFVRNSEDMRIT